MKFKAQPIEERLAAKTVPTDTGCLIWGGAVEDGYARIWHDGRMVRAHRYVWEQAHGPIPNGLEVDHLCHNRACCELTHLRLTSHAENGQNRAGAPKHSTTGVRGVRLHPNGKYQVRASAFGKRYSGGYFSNLNEAAAAAEQLRLRVQAPIPIVKAS